MSDPTNFPLSWPAHRPRLDRSKRKNGQFRANGSEITLAAAVDRVEVELERMKATYPLISTNVQPRLDGRPRGGQAAPDDPGVCVYFHLKGQPIALACDRYTTVQDNLAAVAAHLEATRAIERHGVATAAETLQAFQALPPPAGKKPKRAWWVVLGVDRDSDPDVIRAVFRAKAKKAHPDHGGSAEALAELTEANREAVNEVGA